MAKLHTHNSAVFISRNEDHKVLTNGLIQEAIYCNLLLHSFQTTFILAKCAPAYFCILASNAKKYICFI